VSSGRVLHINAVGLMAELEESLEPSLRRRPFVVANERLSRAVVLDVSALAHREGARPGMSLAAARALLPGLVATPPRAELYRDAEDRLWRLALELTPLVERAGRGHLFADLTGTGRLYGPPDDAAQRLRSRILAETGLSPALALSSTKTASKVATRVFRPGGFVALSTAEEGPLVRRQPASLLPGVGPALLRRLALLEIDDIGGIADLDDARAAAVGPRGRELVARARCVDDSPVNPLPLGSRSASAEAVLEPDTADPEALRLRLLSLSAELAFSLRRDGLGFSYRGSASARSARRLWRDDEALALALEALGRARTRRVRVRSMALTLSGLGAAGPELDLFEPGESRLSRLQSALDSIRGRYGSGAIEPCALTALGPSGAVRC